MKNKSIAGLLIGSIFILSLVPMIGAFYFVDQILETNMNLIFNSEIKDALQIHSANLKKLKTFDPRNEPIYRQQFAKIQTLNLIYGDSDLVKQTIFSSLKLYFVFGFISVLGISVIVGLIINGVVGRRYRALFKDWQIQSTRISTLQNLNRWQEFAKMLAHEIKNPLTPIEVLVTSLGRSHEVKPAPEFRDHLQSSQRMILEELSHLKNLVYRFSEFAKLPELDCQSRTISELTNDIVNSAHRLYPDLVINSISPIGIEHKTVFTDLTLIRLVFINIFKNGIEANSSQKVSFTLHVSLCQANRNLNIDISNTGVPIEPSLIQHLFEPTISTHKTKDNMGLGLAMAKKILIEHRGDIDYFEHENLPHFKIVLPLEDVNVVK